jgi:hypothetical protein
MGASLRCVVDEPVAWTSRKKGVEWILGLTVRVAIATKAVKPKSVEKVIADTTVMEENVPFPTDSKLYPMKLRMEEFLERYLLQDPAEKIAPSGSYASFFRRRS